MAEPERQPKERERHEKMNERERLQHMRGETEMRHEEVVREGPWIQAIAEPAARAPFSHISWSSVFAGLAIALITQIILSTIGGAIGLSVGTGQAVTTALGIWTAISGLVALFLGGWIAARMAAFGTIGIGIVHGILVWALFFITAVGLATAGAPAVLGLITPPVITVDQAAAAAGYALLGMALSLAAAIIGGIIGGVTRQRQMMAERPGGRFL